MLLALMDNDVRAVFLLLAVIAFAAGVVVAFLAPPRVAGAVALVALGLALFVFPAMYDAFDA